MKYLKQFAFSIAEFDRNSYYYAPIESLTDFPIKSLFSGNFEFRKENFEDIVNKLSEIKTLVGFVIHFNLERLSYHLMIFICLRIFQRAIPFTGGCMNLSRGYFREEFPGG